MICKNCGNEIAEGNQFCENCGAAVEVEEVVAAEAEVVAEAAPEVTSDPGKVLGIVSLICGIFGLAGGSLCSCLFACLGGFVPLCASVAGIITGILGMNKSKAAGFKNTMALIGLILSIAAIVIVLTFIVVNAVIGGIGAMSSASYY